MCYIVIQTNQDKIRADTPQKYFFILKVLCHMWETGGKGAAIEKKC